MALRHYALGLWCLAGLYAQPAVAADELVILTVDATFLETGMPLYAELDKQADALRAGADEERRAQVDLAVELRRSEVLTVMPDVIAEIAKAEDADLVIDRSVATRIQQKNAKDITAAVQARLEAQFAGQKLETDP